MSDGIMVSVLALPEACWRCGGATRSIVGVLEVDGRVRRFDGELGAALARSIPNSALAELGVGPLLQRRHAKGGIQWRNCCLGCEIVQGEVPLAEAFDAHLAEGGTLGELVTVRLRLHLEPAQRAG